MLFVSALNVSHDNADDDDNGDPKAIADQLYDLEPPFPLPHVSCLPFPTSPLLHFALYRDSVAIRTQSSMARQNLRFSSATLGRVARVSLVLCRVGYQ